MVKDRVLLFVVIVSLALNVTGLGWGLPPDGQHGWDVDGIAPLGPLVAAKRMLIDDWWNSGYYSKYPVGHYFLLMATYAPYVGYLWLSGGLRNPSEVYPFGFRDPETALMVFTLIARSVHALMGVGIVVLVYLTVRRFANRRAALFSGLTIAFSPAFIFYAHTGNVDTPSLFWAALGLFAFGRLVAGECERRNYLLLGAAVGMAAATKEQAAPLFLLVPVAVVILHHEHLGRAPRDAWAYLRTAVDRTLLAGLGISLATFVVATHLIFNWHGNVLRFRWRLLGIHPTYGSEYPGARPEVDGPIEALLEIVSHTWQSMNPVLFLAGVTGLVLLSIRHRWARYFLLPIVSYVGFVGVVYPLPFFRARFVMEVVLVLALFAGPVLAALWTMATGRNRALVAPLLLLWTYSFLYGAEVNYLLVKDARYDAEAWLAAQTPPGSTVEAFSAPVYLPRFPRHLHVQHHAKMRAADLPALLAGLDRRAPDLLVFSDAFSRRFEHDPEAAAEFARLFKGQFGYGPVTVFRREPVIGPRLIPGLSPEIVVLGNDAKVAVRGALSGFR